MCTVTIVPTPGGPATGWRMACSRDEQHGRTPANPPQIQIYSGTQVLMPTDPRSEGTWVAVNEHGLGLTLLNYNLPDPPIGRALSRGLVIPRLIAASSIDEAIVLLSAIERERMSPFRLVACDGASILLWRSTEPAEHAERALWDGKPVMFTSSGLGDHHVEGPRRELFDSWFGEDASSYTQRQESFHRHQWPGREHLSVCMHRADARTVSYTTIDVSPMRITMTYHPDRPDLDSTDTVATLERRQVMR